MTNTELTDNAERAAYIAGLRQFADLLENDPGLSLPDTRRIDWYLFAGDAGDTEQKRLAADLVRRLPGQFDKCELDRLFCFRGSIEGLGLEVTVDRSAVCRRVVVGTKTVKKPDPAAPLIEVEVDEVEWQCEPLLADAVAAS